ncbi:Maf-like protein, putative [Plasmodium chabaudi chabaudi]|uniref:Maf-like protein, putative n=1 Tax=Plasmodium chabaudi chabaudi TaxID=31271 RepID=A0A1C6X5S9_PLACU|nr:Maf-like protein, putative [Plasmodium chabaudi chabaudi]
MQSDENNKTNKPNELFPLENNNEHNKSSEEINEFELEVDEEIIKYLSSLISNKNVKHKIVKINNLIDDQLYNYILTGKDLTNINSLNNDPKEEHQKIKTNQETLDTSHTFNQTNNEANKYDIHSKSSNNFDLIKRNTLSLFLPSKSEQQKEDKIKCNGNEHKCRNFKSCTILNETTDVTILYNRNDAQTNVLYVCYDEENDECEICNSYRLKYMPNMSIFKNSNISVTPKNISSNDINSISKKCDENLLNALKDYFFVLGSTSSSRKYILKKSELNFLSVQIKIDEKRIGCRKKLDPFTLTSNISVAKGMKLLNIINKDNKLKQQILELSKNKKVILLVGDEVIYCNDQIYEKPKNEQEAYNFIKSYNNNKCYSYSSITLIDLMSNKIMTGIDESVLKFRNMNDDVIKNILNDESIYYCAGALKIENDVMSKYLQEIKGNIDSIFGLSLNLLFHLINLL